MAQASVGWRTMTGIQILSSSFWPEVCVEADTDLDPATENGIDRVDFAVQVNGGAAAITSITQRTLRFPNHSKVNTPLQTRRAGVMAPFKGFGFKIDPLQYPVGAVITITATVYSRLGTATSLPWPIRLYNDRDGISRAPSTRKIYVSPTGNDGNSGLTEQQAVFEIQKAMELAANGGDSGGSEIVFLPGTHVMRNYYQQPTIYTGGDWWAQWTLLPGAKLRRNGLTTDDFIVATGNGPGSSCRIRIVGGKVEGIGAVFTVSSAVRTQIWFDGTTYSSEHYDPPTKRWSVRMIEDQGKMCKLNPTSANGQVFATCCTAAGVLDGFVEIFHTQDCLVTDFIGVALYTFDFGGGLAGQICNAIVERQRAYRDLAGRFRGPVGAGAIVTVPAAGQMRIDAVGPTFFSSEGDFAAVSLATLAEIAGQPAWRVALSGGFPAGGTGLFSVIAAGTNGNGWGYVIVANPSATAGTCTSTARLETATAVGLTDLVHPDVVYMGQDGGIGQTNAIVSNLACRDLDNAQTLFTSDTNLTRALFNNCRDGNNKPLNANMIDGSKTDVRFVGCTMAGNLQLGGAQTNVTFVNNVAGTLSGLGSGAFARNNHVVSGPVPGFGTQWSSGAWFATNAIAEPWHYNPLPALFGTGSSLAPQDPEEYWFGAKATTKGCNRFVGLIDWTTSAETTAIFAIDVASPRSIDLALSAGSLVSLQVAPAYSVELAATSFPVFGIEVAAPVVVEVGVEAFGTFGIDVAPPASVDLAVEMFGIIGLDIAGGPSLELGIESGVLLDLQVDAPYSLEVGASQGSLFGLDVAPPYSLELAATEGVLVGLDVAPPAGVDIVIAVLDDTGRALLELDIGPPFGVDLAVDQGSLIAIDVADPGTVEVEAAQGNILNLEVVAAGGVDVAVEQHPFVALDVTATPAVTIGIESSASTEVFFPARTAPGSLRRWPLQPPQFWS